MLQSIRAQVVGLKCQLIPQQAEKFWCEDGLKLSAFLYYRQVQAFPYLQKATLWDRNYSRYTSYLLDLYPTSRVLTFQEKAR